jgi:hypothetical protein
VLSANYASRCRPRAAPARTDAVFPAGSPRTDAVFPAGQVKELGLALWDCPAVAADAAQYLADWQAFA